MKAITTVALVALALTAAQPALAATAFWTGKQVQVTTVTYKIAWNCEYNYAGQTFWRVYETSCPSSVEVQ